MQATRLTAAIIGAALLTSCSQTAVTRVPVATGGSKADGTIQLAHERKASEIVTVDWAAAEQNALKRCRSWGYSHCGSFRERGDAMLGNRPGAPHQWRRAWGLRNGDGFYELSVSRLTCSRSKRIRGGLATAPLMCRS